MRFKTVSNPTLIGCPEPKAQEAYRGYLIRTNALLNSMWIERDGQLVHRVPADKSWDYAREVIDQLTA